MTPRVVVQALVPFVDRAASAREGREVRRAEEDTWEEDLDRALDLQTGRLLRILDSAYADTGFVWGGTNGRLLETAWRPPGRWGRVVACLNVWEDAPALVETVPTWLDHVDHVIAVDGAYAGAPVPTCASADGTLAFLRSLGSKAELVEAPADGFWPDQVAKRNAYMERLRDDDLAFVVDADEFVEGAEILRTLPDMDVGWVVYRKDIYDRPQNFPRLFAGRIRPRYGGRHYWVTGRRGPVSDCQTGGVAYDHAFVPVRIDNTQRRRLRPPVRRTAEGLTKAAQQEREALVGPAPVAGREALRIIHVAGLDAGMVVFRLHSATNSTTPHESAMAVSPRPDRPYREPRQLCLRRDRGAVQAAVRDADVVHCHLSYHELDALGVPFRGAVVIHHHGTMYRTSAGARNTQDARRAHLRLVSNPELLRYGDGLVYLPNPVPAARYRRMRERLWRPDPDGWVRVGHSPSKRENKGTEAFLAAVERLRAGGVKVRPVLIENATHAESLRRKAREVDVFFDSFWLGMQCSGLEAAAMGIPVVAGDEHVRAFHGGRTPYAYADDGDALAEVLRDMAASEEVRYTHGESVAAYVARRHDYAAVASRYLDALDDAVGWRDAMSLGDPRSRALPLQVPPRG